MQKLVPCKLPVFSLARSSGDVSPPPRTSLKITTAVRLTAVKLVMSIHDPERINPHDLGDLLTFCLAPPLCQIFDCQRRVALSVFLLVYSMDRRRTQCLRAEEEERSILFYLFSECC